MHVCGGHHPESGIRKEMHQEYKAMTAKQQINRGMMSNQSSEPFLVLIYSKMIWNQDLHNANCSTGKDFAQLTLNLAVFTEYSLHARHYVLDLH